MKKKTQEMIIPYGDRVLIQVPDPEEMSTGGIIIPDMAQEKAIQGTVVAVGPGTPGPTGFVPTITKEGDAVVFPKFGAHTFSHEGNEYYIIREHELFLNLKQ